MNNDNIYAQSDKQFEHYKNSHKHIYELYEHYKNTRKHIQEGYETSDIWVQSADKRDRMKCCIKYMKQLDECILKENDFVYQYSLILGEKNTYYSLNKDIKYIIRNYLVEDHMNLIHKLCGKVSSIFHVYIIYGVRAQTH